MYIRHNISAMNTARQLQQANKGINKNTEKLATSLRINRAGDDVAGLSISEKLRAQIAGLSKASKNTQDGISLIQTGEGALAEVNNILVRGRELAVQAANDTNTADDRQQLQKEYTALLEEVDRIGQDTEFNTMKLFDGSKEALQLQLGANAHQSQTLQLPQINTVQLQLTRTEITSHEAAMKAVTALDEAAKQVTDARAQFGALQNGFGHNITNLGQTGENLSSADSVIRDANMAFEVMGLTKNEILRDTMQSALSHSEVKNDWVLNLLN